MVGTLRRELLGRILIVNHAHLRRVLEDYLIHYNRHRPHRTLGHRTAISQDHELGLEHQSPNPASTSSGVGSKAPREVISSPSSK